jgi:hypothetical protein
MFYWLHVPKEKKGIYKLQDIVTRTLEKEDVAFVQEVWKHMVSLSGNRVDDIEKDIKNSRTLNNHKEEEDNRRMQSILESSLQFHEAEQDNRRMQSILESSLQFHEAEQDIDLEQALIQSQYEYDVENIKEDKNEKVFSREEFEQLLDELLENYNDGDVEE